MKKAKVLCGLLLSLLVVVPFSGQATTCEGLFQITASQAPRIRSEAEIKEFSMLAFNVENLFVSTGKFDRVGLNNMKMQQGKGPQPKSPEKIAEIAEIIKKADADVAILTEVESLDALNRLLESSGLGEIYRPLLIEGNDGRGIDIGFLVKKDLPWSVRHITHKDMRWKSPQTGEEGPLFSRDLPVLEFRRNDSDPNPLFAVLGNHAKSKRDSDGDPQSFGWRSAQYRAAAEVIASYRERGVSVMFGGDFNTDVRYEPEVRPVQAAGMTSSVINSPGAKPVASLVSHTYHPNGGSTQRSLMDDIMVSTDLMPYVIRAEVLDYYDPQGNVMPIPNSFKQRKRQPSDHRPIFMRIRTGWFQKQ